LLHPAFGDLLSQLSGPDFSGAVRGYSFLTNAQLLGKELTDLMLHRLHEGKFPLELLTFSIDAALPETYRSIRRNGELAPVVDNIRGFLQKRKELGLTRPNVVVQIIGHPLNQKEIGLFIDFWKLEFLRGGITPQVRFDYDFSKDTIFVKRLGEKGEGDARIFSELREQYKNYGES
jgi:hypothetical protein